MATEPATETQTATKLKLDPPEALQPIAVHEASTSTATPTSTFTATSTATSTSTSPQGDGVTLVVGRDRPVLHQPGLPAGAGEVDAVLADARAAGSPSVSEAVHRDWGGYTGYFADPDGFRWEIAVNPDPVGQSLLP